MSLDHWRAKFPALLESLDSSVLGADLRLVARESDEKDSGWKSVGLSRWVMAALAPWATDLLLQSEDEAVIVVEGVYFQEIDIFRRSLFEINPDPALIKSLDECGLLGLFNMILPQAQEKAEESVSADGLLTCTHQGCLKTFKLKKLLNRHVRTVHSETNPHTCPECGKRCRSQSELETHKMAKHQLKKTHRCSLCRKDREFAERGQLNAHLVKVHKLGNPHVKPQNCQVCGLILATPGAVRRHTKIHDNPEVKEVFEVDEDSESEEEDEQEEFVGVACSESGCDRMFKTESAMKCHARVKHGGPPESLECPDCHKVFTQRAHLKIHRRVHTGEKNYQCNQCGKLFAVASNLNQHYRAVHSDKKAKDNVCQACDQLFPTAKDLKEHVKNEHYPPGPPTCSHCSATFDKKTELLIHLRETHPDLTGGEGGQQVWMCGFCQLKCVSQSALEKHMRIHTGERPHNCPVCNKSFVQKSHVNYHVKTVHSGLKSQERPKNKVCPTCNAAFTTASTLAKHIRTHTNERPHTCEICQKSFIQKSHLTVHKRRHTGERPFYCTREGCSSKGFISSSALKTHLQSHDGTRKTHDCQECGAKYLNHSDLVVHSRKHTGERPFTCSTCGKGFTSNRLLEEHTRTHDGTKPFVCKNCNKTFTAASGLRQHLLKYDTCKTLSESRGTFSLNPPPPVEEEDKEALPSSTSPVLMEIDPASNTLVVPTLSNHSTTRPVIALLKPPVLSASGGNVQNVVTQQSDGQSVVIIEKQ